MISEHFDEPTNDNQKLCCKAFGMVIMGTNEFYENNEDLENHHLLNHDKIALSIEEKLKGFAIFDVYQITVGHEHGKENKKCHFQICVELSKVSQATIKPFELTIEGQTYLGMTQKARNSHALKNYCKKDGDVLFLYPEKKIITIYKKDKKGETTDKVDAFSTVVNNISKFQNREEAMDIILTNDPRTGMTMYKNIEYSLDKMLKPVIPELIWKYPEHLKGKYPLVEEWFYGHCVKDGLLRRKGLCLYSKTRAIGKTLFAESLASDPLFVVTFRGTFLAEAVKDKTPKIVILDDMVHYDQKTKQMWKQLVTGQPSSIRDAYIHFNWEYRIPCVITTNDIGLYANLQLDSDFKTSLYFQEIVEFMGPPGSKPDDSLFEYKAANSSITSSYIEEKKKKREEASIFPIFHQSLNNWRKRSRSRSQSRNK